MTIASKPQVTLRSATPADPDDVAAGIRDFFERRGYTRTTRDAIPEELRSTGQFVHACGATAVTMIREIGR